MFGFQNIKKKTLSVLFVLFSICCLYHLIPDAASALAAYGSCIDKDNDGYSREGGDCGAVDCDDNDPKKHPNQIWYKDNDKDGYSDGTSKTKCNRAKGYKTVSELVSISGDCNDKRALINPVAKEVCDNKDNNCDGLVDEDLTRITTCGVGVCSGNSGTEACVSGKWSNNTCNSLFGASEEICDGLDNDCNGNIDEGVKTTYYKDADGDGYGNRRKSIKDCTQPADYVTDKTDCDDKDPNEHPGQVWYKDNDNDGYSNGKTKTSCKRHGYKLASELMAVFGDCNDKNAEIYPGTADNNCNPDPCGQINAPCESEIIGYYTVASAFEDSVITTVASDEYGETLTLEWIPSGDVIDLFITFPGEQRVAYQQYAEMPSLEGANMAAAVMLGLNSSPMPGNAAGCDKINNWPLLGSCKNKGACCDQHDFCISEKCTGEYGKNDSGDLLICTGMYVSYINCLSGCSIYDYACPFRCDLTFPRCSPECQECHDTVVNCYLFATPPGPSNCCDRNGINVCGKKQQCILGTYVYTEPCDCVKLGLNPVDSCYQGDPTFIQPSRRIKSQPETLNKNSESKDFVAKITVPYKDSLVRADVPIFGVAYGTNFKEYRVEYGEGKEPSNWIMVTKSTTPQTLDESSSEMYKSDDLTIHGNLATWDTGLKTYVYLPSYPKDHPVNLKGTYTVRLVVTGKDGSEAEDRVTVEVGDVIPNAWGGNVVSNDEKVVLTLPEQALLDDFRLISIKPAVGAPESTSSDRHIIGNVYEVREADERFTKPAKLQMTFKAEDIGNTLPDKLGIYAFNKQKKEWIYLNSERTENKNTITTDIQKLYPYYALMASNITGEGSSVKYDSRDKQIVNVATVKGNGNFLLKNTFEDSIGEWLNRDDEVGAEVSIIDDATIDGGKALKITNKHVSGNFAVNVIKTPFDAKEFPVVKFDYRIAPDVKTNFLVKVSGRWYEIGFTDDPKELRDKRVNIAHIGDIEKITADNKWHTAKFNLYDMLRTKTGNTVVEEMIMADWDVGGYMKLQFGYNARGATYYIDNFSINREASTARITGNGIEVDNFNQKQKTNSLGGAAFTFNSPDDGKITADFIGEDINGSGNALNLDYDVSKPGSYAGYVSLLDNVDLRDYQVLSLFVKSTEKGQNFLVGLKDRSGNEQKISVNQYLPKKNITSWQNVTIPLVAFTDIKDWTGIENISLSFENSLHDKGEVIVDNIEFRKEIKSLIVDKFEEFNGRNLLGGNQTTFVSGAAAINGQYTKGSPNGLYRISYGGNIGVINAYASELKSFAGWTTELGGIDCSQCGTLSFRIRGAEGGENATISLDDGNFRWGVELAKYIKPSTSWQRVEIPLQEFAEYGVDLTHLAELKLIFEGVKMSGTLYIDDIQFGATEEIQ